MNFDWFMLPLILFLVLLKNYIVFMLAPNTQEDVSIFFRIYSCHFKTFYINYSNTSIAIIGVYPVCQDVF